MVISPFSVLQGISAISSMFSSGSKSSPAKTDSGNDSASLSFTTAIARKYDVRNISPRDMAALSSELYNAGQIPFSTHALLSFQPEMSSTTATSIASQDSPRNYLAQWQKEYEQARSNPSQQPGLEQKRIVLRVLENLATLRTLQQA